MIQVGVRCFTDINISFTLRRMRRRRTAIASQQLTIIINEEDGVYAVTGHSGEYERDRTRSDHDC
jgi:hypothetical protein